MKNFPIVTIYKKHGFNEPIKLELNGDQYHIDRLEEALLEKIKANIFCYEVILNGAIHHSGYVHYKKHKDLKKLIKYLYTGNLKPMVRNLNRH